GRGLADPDGPARADHGHRDHPPAHARPQRRSRLPHREGHRGARRVGRGRGAEPRLTPRVWLVLGDKRGDNAQVEVLADALGWPSERRHIALKEQWVFGKPRVEPSLHHLDTSRSDPLEPPWPDLILTIGRRPSMAALWVKVQSEGHSRVV